MAVSRSSMRRSRPKHREAITQTIKTSSFLTSQLVVYWDSKILQDKNQEKQIVFLFCFVDCRFGFTAKLLGIPKLSSGSCLAIAIAVKKCIDEWGISDVIVGMSFDTTSSNTGVRLAACTLLQAELNLNLLQFACRLHIFEIVAKAAFSICFGPFTSPDVAIFQEFQE